MVEIYDNSMLQCYTNQCQRKYYFQYECGLQNKRSRAALTFGKGVHKGLDQFFMGLPESKAIEEACKIVTEDLDEKRTVANLKAILHGYYMEYKTIAPYDEILGVEKGLRLPLPGMDIEFYALLDKVVRWVYGITAIDHKTSSKYLSTVDKQCQPNHQFTGYIYALRELYPDAWGLIADFVHVGRLLKTGWRTEYKRVNTTRGEIEIDEWLKWVKYTVEGIRRSRETGQWIMMDNECTAFNSECTYKQLCDVPFPTLEESVQSALASGEFEIEFWKPWEAGKK